MNLLNHIAKSNSSEFFKVMVSVLTSMNGRFKRLRFKNIEIDDWSDADHAFERMSSLMKKFQFKEFNIALEGILNGFF